MDFEIVLLADVYPVSSEGEVPDVDVWQVHPPGRMYPTIVPENVVRHRVTIPVSTVLDPRYRDTYPPVTVTDDG